MQQVEPDEQGVASIRYLADEITVALVGQPNVGKSVIMNLLTGVGVMVSNYPGTTVEVTEGYFKSPAGNIRIIDTPGIYSCLLYTSRCV